MDPFRVGRYLTSFPLSGATTGQGRVSCEKFIMLLAFLAWAVLLRVFVVVLGRACALCLQGAYFRVNRGHKSVDSHLAVICLSAPALLNRDRPCELGASRLAIYTVTGFRDV